MSVDRPTFSESWYRVKDLRPKLRAALQTYRQHYRGQVWYVLQDPSNNQFSRLGAAAYHFLGLLDGYRTIGEAWDLSNEQLGDQAPTQGEAIQLLGQLYTSNLLQGDLPPDAAGMFERYRKRVRKEVGSYFKNFLFIRLPLFDPDNILDRWYTVFSWMFTWVGLALWLGFIAVTGYLLIPHLDSLWDQSSGILDPENLVLLYLSFGVIKAIHEFGHGFACKTFGKRNGSGGEVHTMGIMLLVFMPVPYVDASSSWAFRSRWQRAIVGAGGMFVEMIVACIAALVWANTAHGTPLNAICYNVMFIAGVSTILFNGNPLLRYDGYYILSDLVEIPNLAQRSKEYLYYVVKKYVFGVRRPRNPAHNPNERGWLMFYAIASTVYRVFICAAILLFIADALFMIGLILAAAAIVTWVVAPLVKFFHYLLTHEELLRVRSRAIGATAAFFAVLFVLIGMIPFPDRDRAEGVVEPVKMQYIHVEADSGFVQEVLPTGTKVAQGEPLLVKSINVQLESEHQKMAAELALLHAQRRQARTEQVALVEPLSNQIQATEKRLARVEEQLQMLEVRPPHSGIWISPDYEQLKGAYVQRGQQLGAVASLEDMNIYITADQNLGPRIGADILAQKSVSVELRVKSRPDLFFTGEIQSVSVAGQRQLRSAASGIGGGGGIQVEMDDPSGKKAVEPFFEVRIVPEVETDEAVMWSLLSGQRVVARFEMESKPLAEQWWRALRQLIMRRFQI